MTNIDRRMPELAAACSKMLLPSGDSASVGRWRTELTIDVVTNIQRVAGELMIELGYQPVRDLKKFRHLQAEPALCRLDYS
jgi:hypothetical protein